MPFKLLGALTLVFSGVFAGLVCAEKEKTAFVQAEALLFALRDMRCAVRMSQEPLPDIACRLACSAGPAGRVFSRAAELCAEGKGFSQAAQESRSLIADERTGDIFETLFASAGVYDGDETVRRFDTAITELEARTEELKEKYGNKAPLARRLGAAAGICAAILFI